jgi:DNA repair protein RadC
MNSDSDRLREPSFRHTRIKDWPADERPREKLLKRGAQALSDAELLAILIRTGTGKMTALDLARTIITHEKNLLRIAQKSAQELMRLKGIGHAKAVELLAAFEIGRRVQGATPEAAVIIRSPDDVAQRVVPLLRDKPHEVFVVLLLDAKNGLKHEQEVTVGTLNASLVHPREVFKLAIDHRAASVIVAHNHPSGNPEPSAEDIAVTRQLADAGKVVGIPLHDHVIVAGESFTSLAERGLL